MRVLTRPEELALMAVWKLQPEAYGVSIRKYMIDATGSSWSVGAVYDALDRLQLWGLLSAHQADPTPRRGGRSKKYFQITKAGVEALTALRAMSEALWAQLPQPGL